MKEAFFLCFTVLSTLSMQPPTQLIPLGFKAACDPVIAPALVITICMHCEYETSFANAASAGTLLPVDVLRGQLN